MITLPFTLGGKIRDELTKYYRQYKIEEPDEVKALSVYRRRDTFLESELEHVKKLHVDEDVLDYIHLFPNITSLHFDLKCNLSQADIQNVVNRYPNLKELSVIEQNNIQVLNIEGLSNLETLKIIGNNSLRRVIGIDKIANIYDLTLYGNPIYNDYEKLSIAGLKYACDGAQIDLDVLFFPDMMKVLEENKELEEMYELYSSNIKWNEVVGLGKVDSRLRHSSGELKVTYKKALEVCEKYIRETDSEVLKYAILYQWMCENVKYDYNGLDKGHSLIIDGLRRGRTGGANGTVNALVYGYCVCQGYSKALQLLTKVAGIHSYDVECIIKERKSGPVFILDNERTANIGDHSIQKVSLDGRVYYSDATWDAGRIQKGNDPEYFLLSKKDISTTHKLVGEENVELSYSSYLPAEQSILLKSASDRIKQVNLEIKRKKELEELNRSRENNLNVNSSSEKKR